MIGRTVSHFVVTGPLGAGGGGTVYEAQDTRLSRQVALKFLPGDDPSDGRRLLREPAILAMLDHPNICRIYEIGVHEDAPFIVMERLDGVSLRAHMARGRLGTTEIVDIAAQVCGALAAAHAIGVVHCDITPANIFITVGGGVKVLDFGLACRITTPSAGQPMPHSDADAPLGTPDYMAPERILQAVVDPRSDLFSLGAVIYQMATGRRPFAAPSPADTIANVLDVDPVPLRTFAPDRPPRLQQIVTRVLAKNPAHRYASARDLRAALAAITVDPPTPWWRRWPSHRARR